MKISLAVTSLIEYLNKQLNFFYPDNHSHESIDNVVKEALLKVEYCFNRIELKQFYRNNNVYFNHLNADQYTVFIYYASNVAYELFSDEVLATKLFYLNKSLNQFHCMYDTKLPDVFLVIHGVGAVLGKADYSDYLVVSQHCNVGANEKLQYPVLSKYLIMYPNSSIIGDSRIGEKCCLSNGVFINNQNIKDNTLIIGRSPELIMKGENKNRFEYFFK